MSTMDTHLIPSDLALAIWSLTMPVNRLLQYIDIVHLIILQCTLTLYILLFYIGLYTKSVDKS